MGVGSTVISGVTVGTTCGDIVASAGVENDPKTVEVGSAIGVGDGTGPDEQAATTPAATTIIPNDILRSDSTYTFL